MAWFLVHPIHHDMFLIRSRCFLNVINHDGLHAAKLSVSYTINRCIQDRCTVGAMMYSYVNNDADDSNDRHAIVCDRGARRPKFFGRTE